MSGITVCRLCLATDITMHNIGNPEVLEVFEKLTSKKLPEKERPGIVCYLCYSLLRRCSRILSLFRKTENVFDQLSNNGIQITYDTISFLKKRNIVDLCITPLNHIEIAPTISQELKRTDKNIQKVIIKEEPKDELVEVKLEPIELDTECDVVLQDVIYEDSFEESDDITKDNNYDFSTHLIKESKKSSKLDKIEENTQNRSDTVKSYSCTICNKKFERKSYLRRHTAEHNAKKFDCSECSKSFTLKSNLRRHCVIAHTDKINYLCDFCDKVFKRGDNLRLHIRSHTGEKPYPCTFCNKKFVSSSNVQLHIDSVHLNKRPFICDQCNKTFSRKGNLKEHYKSHTGDKPHKCGKCDLSFVRLSNYKKHSSKIHPNS